MVLVVLLVVVRGLLAAVLLLVLPTRSLHLSFVLGEDCVNINIQYLIRTKLLIQISKLMKTF